MTNEKNTHNKQALTITLSVSLLLNILIRAASGDYTPFRGPSRGTKNWGILCLKICAHPRTAIYGDRDPVYNHSGLTSCKGKVAALTPLVGIHRTG